jgi:hypothetical protein
MSDQSTTRATTAAGFSSFIKAGTNRASFISQWLGERNIPCTPVEISGHRHLSVVFPPSSYDPLFRGKILIAHYDRACGTPGANDNSAACFQLLKFAERLASSNVPGTTKSTPHNIKIIFTDGEEAAGSKGIQGQGAYRLGEGLRKLGMDSDDIFVFDACGRGDTLVVSASPLRHAEHPGAGKKFAQRLSLLHSHSLALARTAARGQWMELPTPYSDDAGLLAAGIPAQVFTVLPRIEALALEEALGAGLFPSDGTLIAEILSNRRQNPESRLTGFIPETWQAMHTPRDTAASLTPSAFKLIDSVLDGIAKLQIPKSPA